MAILIFALSLALLIAGGASGYMSLDLLPTSAGVLYALAGAVAVSMAVVTFALGVLVRRIGVLTELLRPDASLMSEAAAAPSGHIEPVLFPGDSAPTEMEGAVGAADVAVEAEGGAEPAPLVEEAEDPISQNHGGHLPTPGEGEHAIETPEAPPSLVGRYSSGGANYMIFADGSIEAETPEGAFRFASMGEFKRYLAERTGDAWTTPASRD